MKRIARLVLTGLVVAAIAAGGLWYYRNRVASAAGASGSTYTQVVAVKQGNLSSTLSVVGSLEASQSASLAFERMSSTAKLATLTVKTGATVTAGQTLATIDPAAYQQALDQAKSDLLAAEKKLADLTTAATALETAQADVTVAKAQQSLAQAKADLADLIGQDLTSLERAVKDAQDGITILEIQATLAEYDSLAKSERDLTYTVNWYERRITELQALKVPNLEQSAELTKDMELLAAAKADLARVKLERNLAAKSSAAEMLKAKATLATAQEALATARAGGDKLVVAKAQVAVNDAQVLLQSAQEARKKLDEGADATTIATARADVDKKKLAVTEAEAALTGTTLKAPFGGTILKTNVSVGDQVAANTVVLTMANLKTLRVEASIAETSIRQVAVGQTAAITFDAYPGQTFQGKVLEVPMQGALQGGVTVYAVPISLTGAEKLSLLVGMTANVKVQVGSVSNALLIPTLALQRASGQYQVLVANTSDPNGAPEAVPVEVGLSDGTYTQITKGLNLGDQVVYTIASSSSSSSQNRGGASYSIGIPGIR
jgi:HlyD family secretion protein